jgi:hypothetical protein
VEDWYLLTHIIFRGVLFIWETSFNKWATEALFSSALLPTQHIYDVQEAADSYGFTLGRENTDLAYIILIGVVFRALGYVALVFVNRDKQK